MIDLIWGVCKQTRDVTMLHRVTFVKIGLRGICRGDGRNGMLHSPSNISVKSV